LEEGTPSKRFGLQEGEVHVWRLSLDLPAQRVWLLRHSIDENEATRASRFHRETDRMRFIVAHAQLRSVLAGYLNAPPEQLKFRNNRWGKPYLAPEGHGADLAFNYSRSNGIGLCAVSRGRQVGVDVEHVRSLPDYAEIAARFFSPPEVEALNATPEPMRQRVFYTFWTRKEAYVKALGKGLSVPLDQFDISRGSVAEVDSMDSTMWSIQDMDLGESYVGSIVVEGDAPAHRFWDWPDHAFGVDGSVFR
jgi:4'-phosphopantetheinyl transferase